MLERLFIVMPLAVMLSFAGTFIVALAKQTPATDLKHVGTGIFSTLLSISYLVHRSTHQDVAHFSLMFGAAALLSTVIQVFMKRRPV